MATKTKTIAPVANVPAIMPAPKFDMPAALALAKSAASNTGKAVNVAKAAEQARDAFCAFIVEAGMSFTAPKDGTNDPVILSNWVTVKTLASRAATLKGRAISDEDHAAWLDDKVPASRILSSVKTKKAGQSEGTATWNGTVTAQIKTWRGWMDSYTKRNDEAETETAARKNDREFIVAKLGDIAKRLTARAKKEAPDDSFDAATIAAFTKDFGNLVETYKLK